MCHSTKEGTVTRRRQRKCSSSREVRCFITTRVCDPESTRVKYGEGGLLK